LGTEGEAISRGTGGKNGKKPLAGVRKKYGGVLPKKNLIGK